ncbi:hypothetical protein [Carnobacterium maltaromaticum]|uniref:hypothetical protein n=1 Tax=Carnobacterium maltaromaticum TaxID=2751 RepID=UPI0012FA0652|nr:hypothetical protein [Carnobacterium maltaromaticum]
MSRTLDKFNKLAEQIDQSIKSIANSLIEESPNYYVALEKAKEVSFKANFTHRQFIIDKVAHEIGKQAFQSATNCKNK